MIWYNRKQLLFRNQEIVLEDYGKSVVEGGFVQILVDMYKGAVA